MESSKITNWDEYNRTKEKLNDKEHKLLGGAKASDLLKMENYVNKCKKIAELKNNQMKIIKEHSNLIKIKDYIKDKAVSL